MECQRGNLLSCGNTFEAWNEAMNEELRDFLCTDEAALKRIQQIMHTLSSSDHPQFTIVNIELCKTKHVKP